MSNDELAQALPEPTDDGTVQVVAAVTPRILRALAAELEADPTSDVSLAAALIPPAHSADDDEATVHLYHLPDLDVCVVCGGPIEAERLRPNCLAKCASSDNFEAMRWQARGSVDDIRWRRVNLPPALREPSQKYDED